MYPTHNVGSVSKFAQKASARHSCFVSATGRAGHGFHALTRQPAS